MHISLVDGCHTLTVNSGLINNWWFGDRARFQMLFALLAFCSLSLFVSSCPTHCYPIFISLTRIPNSTLIQFHFLVLWVCVCVFFMSIWVRMTIKGWHVHTINPIYFCSTRSSVFLGRCVSTIYEYKYGVWVCTVHLLCVLWFSLEFSMEMKFIWGTKKEINGKWTTQNAHWIPLKYSARFNSFYHLFTLYLTHSHRYRFFSWLFVCYIVRHDEFLFSLSGMPLVECLFLLNLCVWHIQTHTHAHTYM